MHLLPSSERPQWLERHLEYLVSVVLGWLWWDEWKGKIVDWLMEHSDVVIRFNGGHNAGHTVVDGQWQAFDLHILPSWSVRGNKINIITSGCVLGLDLPKIDLGKMLNASAYGGLVFNQTLGELRKRYTQKDEEDGKGIKWEPVRAGLIPELEQLMRKGVDVKWEPVKISAQTPMIGVHHVLLDALDEEIRASKWLRKIGSTGSGITRAYESKDAGNNFSLETLLNHPEKYYEAVMELWDFCQDYFPNISVDEMTMQAQTDHIRLKGLVSQWMIEVIQDEQDYIGNLKNEGKRIVAEGAQGALISANYTPFGTASNPSLETFCTVTGIDPTSIANLFAVFKMPPSSVGTRPQFLAYVENEILQRLRDKYGEKGVSTGRPRDIFRYSLPEFARAMTLMIGDIVYPRERIVPVFNRVDGIPDFAQLEPEGLGVTTGWKYRWATDDVLVWIHHGKTSITPDNTLRNYPDRDTMWSEEVFSATSADLFLQQVLWTVSPTQTPDSVSAGVRTLLRMILASMYDTDKIPEAILGFWPWREESHTFADIDVMR